MSNPIKFIKKEDQNSIHWDESIRRFTNNLDVIELSFKKTKALEIGLVIKLNSNEFDTLWISIGEYFHKKYKDYSEYLRDMYIILGVTFKNESDARIFYDELHKEYMWKILKSV